MVCKRNCLKTFKFFRLLHQTGNTDTHGLCLTTRLPLGIRVVFYLKMFHALDSTLHRCHATLIVSRFAKFNRISSVSKKQLKRTNVTLTLTDNWQLSLMTDWQLKKVLHLLACGLQLNRKHVNALPSLFCVPLCHQCKTRCFPFDLKMMKTHEDNEHWSCLKLWSCGCARQTSFESPTASARSVWLLPLSWEIACFTWHSWNRCETCSVRRSLHFVYVQCYVSRL